MSNYDNYLKKLNAVVQSFELEWKDKLESTKHYYEDIIDKINKQHTEKVALLENDKDILIRNFEAEKSSLVDEHNKKIKVIEEEKDMLRKNFESERASLVSARRKFEAEKSGLISKHNKYLEDFDSSVAITTLVIVVIVFISTWIVSGSLWVGIAGFVAVLIILGILYGTIYGMFSLITG